MKAGLVAMYSTATLLPLAAVAWGLMWVTDRLYESGLGLVAAPIRIVVLLLQFGVLFDCFGVLLGIAVFVFALFAAASQGRDAYSDGRPSIAGYLRLLLLPVAMGIAGAVVALFHNFLGFNEHGLGLVSVGFGAVVWGLQMGSVFVLLIWVAIAPVFLWKRQRIASASGRS